MPILWRYLFTHFFKITLLCLFSLLAILLTMRLDEIAHFVALGAPLKAILAFTFYQIPYILPVTLSLSALTASFLLMRQLSAAHELTALRACGMGLRDMMAPLLLGAFVLSIFNFWMVSEMATQAHLQANTLKNELRSINPLLLLNNKHLMRLKGLYFEALGPSRAGEMASQAVLAIPNKHHQRLNILIAEDLKAFPSLFIGKKVTLLTSVDSGEEEDFDHLFIENIGESITPVQDFSQLLQKKVWTINNDYLKTSFLLNRIQEQKNALKKAQKRGADRSQLKELKEQLGRSQSDIARRFSIAFAVFSLTFMGAAYGMHIGRQKKHRPFFIVVSLTVFYLIAFFVAKGVEHQAPLAISLYILPHFIIIFISIIALKRISRGCE